MFVDHRLDYLSGTRVILSGIVAPIQLAVDKPIEVLDWLESNVATHQVLMTDNARLRGENLLLQARIQRFIALKNENRRLRALLKSSPRAGSRVVVAKLLAVTADPYTQEMVLGKGTKDGVFVGQAVLDANGVLGQVVTVGLLTSRVMMLTDTRSAIPVEDSRNNVRGIVVGRGVSGNLSLIHIPQTADIEPGDALVTSGLGQRFPAGYPVGLVSVVERIPGERFARVHVKPSAHFNQARLVLLVWDYAKQKT